MRNLTLEGKIVLFKSLELSEKTIFHFDMSKVPNNLVRELQNTKKLFLQKTVNTKIGEMLCKNYTDDRLNKCPKKL